MSQKRYLVYYPRDYTVKDRGRDEVRTDFMRCGVAFELEKREGLSLEIHTMPILQPGQTLRFICMPPDDQQQGQRRDERDERGDDRGGFGGRRR